MEHIVLEYDENTRTALVVATSGGHEPVLSGHASPYIVADGYDFESRSWGAGHYALPAPNRAALPAHLAPDRPARDGLGGDARHIRRHGGVAGISRA